MTTINFPKGAERYFVEHSRHEAVKVMKTMYEKGYRWVTRDSDSDSLMLYNLKPKNTWTCSLGVIGNAIIIIR